MSEVPSSSWNVFLYFLAILLPPLAVLFKRGCSADFLISICLSILGWIPGVIHAWYLISKHETLTPVRSSLTNAPSKEL